VAAPGTASAFDEAGLFEFADELFQILDRDALAGGDILDPHRPVFAVAGHVKHHAGAVAAAGGELHGRISWPCPGTSVPGWSAFIRDW